MISCTEFIPAYSELFRVLESTGGKEAVVRFWEDLSDFAVTHRQISEEEMVVHNYQICVLCLAPRPGYETLVAVLTGGAKTLGGGRRDLPPGLVVVR